VRRRLLPTAATLLGACVIGLLIYGVSAQSANRTLDDQVARGLRPPAPQAGRTLPSLSGGAGPSLASLRGKVVVLNFWASWCTPCEAEAPLLEHAQATLERHRATVLGVTFKDIASDSRAFVRRFRLTYPNVRDTEGSFAASFGTDQLPETFVIDRQGRIVQISRGEIEAPFLDRAIALARGA
jgi:cytochrome c biogenesis protein CcmG, thiol:disulfide interchange protein DsbE